MHMIAVTSMNSLYPKCPQMQKRVVARAMSPAATAIFTKVVADKDKTNVRLIQSMRQMEKCVHTCSFYKLLQPFLIPLNHCVLAIFFRVDIITIPNPPFCCNSGCPMDRKQNHCNLPSLHKTKQA